MNARDKTQQDLLVRKLCEGLSKHDVSFGSRTVVFGLSGGIDSVVLLHALASSSVPIRAVHVNYQLRGRESDADEEFVRAFCDQLSVPLQIESVDTRLLCESLQTSVQDAARQFRYQRFHEIAVTYDAEFVAVAHNRDDQAETVLMHLARGTGISGAAGMAFRRRSNGIEPVEVIRPLLYCSRKEILSYAQVHALQWREDSSNVNQKYTRSRVRSELRPVFKRVLGEAAWDGLASSAELLRELVEEGSYDIAPVLLEGGSASRQFSIDVLTSVSPGVRDRIVLECLKHWAKRIHPTRKIISEVSSLIEQTSGSEKVYGDTRIVRERNWLVFSDVVPAPPEFVNALAPGSSVQTPMGLIRFDELVRVPATVKAPTANMSFVDLDTIGELHVRSWANGDRMMPFGGTGSTNVSDILTDAKVPSSDRSRYLVVVDSDKTIIWVVGLKSGEPARVTPRTKRVGLLSLLR